MKTTQDRLSELKKVMPKTIQEYWEDFQRKVISADAPETQRKEMKLAFYGGVTAALTLVQTLGLDETEEEAELRFFAWKNETVAYAKSFLPKEP